jgi:hypothetical protein
MVTGQPERELCIQSHPGWDRSELSTKPGTPWKEKSRRLTVEP